jgi:hypothetical protein
VQGCPKTRGDGQLAAKLLSTATFCCTEYFFFFFFSLLLTTTFLVPTLFFLFFCLCNHCIWIRSLFNLSNIHLEITVSHHLPSKHNLEHLDATRFRHLQTLFQPTKQNCSSNNSTSKLFFTDPFPSIIHHEVSNCHSRFPCGWRRRGPTSQSRPSTRPQESGRRAGRLGHRYGICDRDH